MKASFLATFPLFKVRLCITKQPGYRRHLCTHHLKRLVALIGLSIGTIRRFWLQHDNFSWGLIRKYGEWATGLTKVDIRTSWLINRSVTSEHNTSLLKPVLALRLYFGWVFWLDFFLYQLNLRYDRWLIYNLRALVAVPRLSLLLCL